MLSLGGIILGLLLTLLLGKRARQVRFPLYLLTGLLALLQVLIVFFDVFTASLPGR